MTRRWNAVSLIEMLNEAMLRTGCLHSITTIAGSSSLSDDVLAERLMLAIYSYGANSGVKAVAAVGGGHGYSEDGIRYVRRRYLSPQVARSIAIDIATFAARDLVPVGAGTTAVASDSMHFRAGPAASRRGSTGHGQLAATGIRRIADDRSQQSGLFKFKVKKIKIHALTS